MNHLLTDLYVLGAIYSSLATVVLMQVTWQSDADRMDAAWLRNMRRASLAALSLSLLYGANYVAREIEAPWLPNVLLVCSISVSVSLRVVAIWLRAPAVHKMVLAGFIKAE